jgi:hypothetical protein
MEDHHQKCLCCGAPFTPDPRNRHRQEFCLKQQCRKAMKSLSQRRWLAKGENAKYWTGTNQVERVQAWRKAHPKYWKRGIALQEYCLPSNPLLIGLIAEITGSTLQEDIVANCARLVSKGRKILARERIRRKQTR